MLKITQEKHTSEAYLESGQISNMKLFKKIANGFKPFLIFAKRSILDISMSPEYASVSIEKYMFYRLERDRKESLLQYLMVLKQPNITCFWMITV